MIAPRDQAARGNALPDGKTIGLDVFKTRPEEGRSVPLAPVISYPMSLGQGGSEPGVQFATALAKFTQRTGRRVKMTTALELVPHHAPVGAVRLESVRARRVVDLMTEMIPKPTNLPNL